MRNNACMPCSSFLLTKNGYVATGVSFVFDIYLEKKNILGTMKGVDKAFVNKVIVVAIAGIAVMNFAFIWAKLSDFWSAFSPLFIGIIFALIINVPMEFFEKKVFKKGRFRLQLSLGAAVLIFFGVLVGFCFLLAPKVAESLGYLVKAAENGDIKAMMEQSSFGAFLYERLADVIASTVKGLNSYLPKVVEIVGKVASKIVNLLLGIFFAIMMLANKKQLSGQMKKLADKLFKQARKRQIYDLFSMALYKFSRYLGGQIIEAMVLGVVCYLFMLALGLPFAPLISLITAVVNLIPILGAYAGGFVSALLIFTVSPQKALIFIVFIVCLQQLESVTTYPVIVGRYVGLNGFWILFSVVIGGALFGFVGVFLGVPVVAFLHDFVGGLLSKKEQKTELTIPPSFLDKT